MKKLSLIILGIIVAAMVLSSCVASNTCATYAGAYKVEQNISSTTCAANKQGKFDSTFRY